MSQGEGPTILGKAVPDPVTSELGESEKRAFKEAERLEGP